MMNDCRESDRLVVPEKSPNKAGQPVAEGMEGRGLAKGNSPQQNAPRTPSRDGAPSALERIRQAARRDKRQRFTALLHHVYDLSRLRVMVSSGEPWTPASSKKTEVQAGIRDQNLPYFNFEKPLV
jgi:hypothetical protein